MEVVRNHETHAGRSAAVKMKMASQITGPHLSSSSSLSNHTALRLQQPTPSPSSPLCQTAYTKTAARTSWEKPRPQLLTTRK